MRPDQQLARLTGLLYLLIILCAGFAQGYVRGTLWIPGDAGATIQNIAAAEGLFRLGLVADLLAFLADLAVAVLLFQLLRHVDFTLSLMAAAFRLVAHPAIGSLNLLNHYLVLEVLQGAGQDVFADAAQGVHFLFTAHQYGYLLAGAFFGIHCLLLGILLYRSERFPRLLGILLGLSALGYLLESFGDLLVPGYEATLAMIVGLTAAIGEVSLALYLVVKGLRSPNS